MSEIKFSCPGCQQNLQAPPEYAGMQINCPSCKTALIVPAPEGAPPPPGAAPGGPKLSTATSTAHTQPASASGAVAMAAMLHTNRAAPKKKLDKSALIGGIVTAALAIAAVVYFWPQITQYFKHESQAKIAAEQAATNQPPPPPPPLTTEEILAKVGDTYKEMTDYGAKARTECSIDMSGYAPGKGKISFNTTSTLQLGRTNFYRLEWEQNLASKLTKGAAWNSGKGDFVGYGPYTPGKVKTREDAFAPASQNFFLLSPGIAELFFASTNSLAAQAKDFTKTNAPSMDGRETYALYGEENHQSLVVWIDKKTFLVSEIQLTLGGAIPDAELKKLPSAQRNVLAMLSKLKGTITETYDNIQKNQNLQASAFDSPYTPSANPDGQAQAQRPQHASSMAGQLTNPRRKGAQAQ